MYHGADHKIYLGIVVGLDYANPYTSPFQELQKLKTHPEVRKYIEGGDCIQYGARALNEGGYYSVPKLTFPGGMLVGCSAGFLNVAKIKGVHNAMKTGILAADSIIEHLKKPDSKYPKGQGKEMFGYYEKFKQSWVHEELFMIRNVRPAFHNGFW